MVTATSRKYKAYFAAFLMSSFLLVIDKLVGGDWVTFNLAIFSAYMIGNVGEHYTKRGNP